MTPHRDTAPITAQSGPACLEYSPGHVSPCFQYVGRAGVIGTLGLSAAPSPVCVWPFQSTYSEVRSEYVRFQTPADFEPRLAAVSSRLEETQRQAAQAERETSEPTDIQGQMDSCLVSPTRTHTHRSYLQPTDIQGQDSTATNSA